MAPVLALDVYGTLIDTGGVVERLRGLVGDRAEVFSRAWRDKQLEYSFRRGLMGRYVPFPVCTRQSLDFVCASFGLELAAEARQELLELYRQLPAFPDAGPGLSALAGAGFRLYAFSNGTAEDVSGLLEHAGLREGVVDIVSVEEIESFKPDPAVYRHFLQRAGARASDAWLVSANPFDVIGARSTGMRSAWVRRGPAVFDPWEFEPTLAVADLAELADRLGPASAEPG